MKKFYVCHFRFNKRFHTWNSIFTTVVQRNSFIQTARRFNMYAGLLQCSRNES